jgi:hypothetical protein
LRFDRVTPVQAVNSSDARLLRGELTASTAPASLTAVAKINRALESEATKLTFDIGERTAILEALGGTESSSLSPRLRELYQELRDQSNR